jgi:hypothetical protein
VVEIKCARLGNVRILTTDLMYDKTPTQRSDYVNSIGQNPTDYQLQTVQCLKRLHVFTTQADVNFFWKNICLTQPLPWSTSTRHWRYPLAPKYVFRTQQLSRHSDCWHRQI